MGPKLGRDSFSGISSLVKHFKKNNDKEMLKKSIGLNG
jgi:hypothetical protein